MHPDPKKVQGITEMTAPMDKQQLQSFLGMVNYMGTFIPNLSLLAIVFACQCFSTYLLGRSFVAESDHKPLEMIAMKNLRMRHHVFRECCWSYRDMMSPSSTDQGRKCNWPMTLAAARQEPHRKSNWICE